MLLSAIAFPATGCATAGSWIRSTRKHAQRTHPGPRQSHRVRRRAIRCADKARLSARAGSQAHRTRELCEHPIECTEWQVTGLSRDLQYEAIGKTGGRPLSKILRSRRHDIGVLNRQLLVVEK